MEGIEIMMQEHKHIKRMLVVVRKACNMIIDGYEIDYNDFDEIISFIKNYSDKHHHNKEEKLLFTRMVEDGDAIAEKLINYGMLIEHDLGRMYIRDLEEAIAKARSGDKESKVDIIANAISYTHLLERHIDKEDNVVYTYALKHLPQRTIDDINKECNAYEAESIKQSVIDNNMIILKVLEQKYCN